MVVSMKQILSLKEGVKVLKIYLNLCKETKNLFRLFCSPTAADTHAHTVCMYVFGVSAVFVHSVMKPKLSTWNLKVCICICVFEQWHLLYFNVD